jgi:MFS family permease
MIAPLTVLYFTRFAGLSAASVGRGLALAGIAALCLVPLAGVATDRFGPRRTLMAYWAMSAAAYAAHALVHAWLPFVVVTAAALASGYSTKSVKQAYLAELSSGDDRVRLMAFQRSVRNAGFALGGLLSALALVFGNAGYLAVVLGNAVSYCAAMALLPPAPAGSAAAVAAAGRRVLRWGDYRHVLADTRYTALTALDFLVCFQATALVVALPLWVASHTSVPDALVGVLFTLNTLLVVLLQMRVAARASSLADVPRLYTRSALLFGCAAAVYLLAGHAPPILAVAFLVIAVSAHSAMELYASTAEWTVAAELADPERRGAYLAVFWSGSSLQQVLGPVIVTSVLTLNTTVLWPIVAAAAAVGCLLSARIVRRSASRANAVVPAAGIPSTL